MRPIPWIIGGHTLFEMQTVLSTRNVLTRMSDFQECSSPPMLDWEDGPRCTGPRSSSQSSLSRASSLSLKYIYATTSVHRATILLLSSLHNPSSLQSQNSSLSLHAPISNQTKYLEGTLLTLISSVRMLSGTCDTQSQTSVPERNSFALPDGLVFATSPQQGTF